MTFQDILDKYRKRSFSERDKGARFERLMQAYLQTDPLYAGLFSKVWLWEEFPYRGDLGGKDTGIDLVAQTHEGDFWAIQCKCQQQSAIIDKGAVDAFLATSSRTFRGDDLKTVRFAHRLWIATTNKWGANAEEAIHNQSPPVQRIGLHQLLEAPVDWGKLERGIHGDASRKARKRIRPHQQTAVQKASDYFQTADRGKLIMACGTGKTYTALRIAEQETGGRGLILFLVPSISLLSQTLREWHDEAKDPIHAICICSDPQVSARKGKADDSDFTSTVDLALPASTKVRNILEQFERIRSAKKPGMTVVFSTYQSIEVVAEAQRKSLKAGGGGCGVFDLVICDEAHRTTGVALAAEDSSAFIKVHDNGFLEAKKRLYMTATPRLYSDDAKSKAAQSDAILCSMDDESLYGEEIHRIGFGEAVERDLLSDYRVLILTLSEKDVPPRIQHLFLGKDMEIKADDQTKLIGSINALSKQLIGSQGVLKKSDPEPMRRAVAFCQSIPVSKKITHAFDNVSRIYLEALPDKVRKRIVSVTANHVDGTMSAPRRDELLSWLKEDGDDRECRVLTNVRCLSEGVDVPALDAVLFLSARNSQVDVVQSVGRVMRKAPGKKYGYIIIPVMVPSDMDPAKALADNERYKVVWTVLNALRAHDDRFNATINKIDLNKRKPDQILVGGAAVTWEDGEAVLVDDSGKSAAINEQMLLQFEELQGLVYARMVEKVGSRSYWEDWARRVGQVAKLQEERITRLVKAGGRHQEAFEGFLAGLRKNLNPAITAQEAVEMLAQHTVTRPVFEALFEGYSFVKNNPVSKSMQAMLNLLDPKAVERELGKLDEFYDEIRKSAAGIDNAEGRQRVIIKLYDTFFKIAFPRMQEKLGIVYTPVEVVDFIIHSVEDVLRAEFGRGLSDENVHILDPFTGTGTFVTRLLQSGFIQPRDLPRKYAGEIHANEIVLLAYYIAAVNIEHAYHDATEKAAYEPFEGICLTDTFQLGESDGSDHLFTEMFPQNSERVARQKKAPLRVIMGNPPYSVGQKSANDNAQNQKYERLDRRIAGTYAAGTQATLKNSLYDSYFKAFRWSADRLDPAHGGIVCFVSNGAWLDGNAQDGFRKCLEAEFSSIYVFNLRGNARTQGELRQKEAGNVFGSGSRTPIAITLLVKKPHCAGKRATIHYKDIGDYLKREEKLAILQEQASILNPALGLQVLTPNEHGDWIVQRNDLFSTLPAMEPSKKFDPRSTSYISVNTRGLATSRDAWCYNFSRSMVSGNIQRSMAFFNAQSKGFVEARKANPTLTAEQYITLDSTEISWDRQQKKDVASGKHYAFHASLVMKAAYRPFQLQWVYMDRQFNNCVYQMPKLFPTAQSENLVICVPGPGGNKDLSVLMTDCIPDLHLNGDTQAFPLYYYEEASSVQRGLFDGEEAGAYVRRDGVTDFILGQARARYGKAVGKEDIFYYVYGFLHSPAYRAAFANDLKKGLPRLPLVDAPKDFWAFSKAGRALAELHVGYERVPPCPGVVVTGAESGAYRVEKMRFPKKGQKDSIVYNSRITVGNIPAKAYDYVVNGKSAVEWVMERYQVTTHKDSGIVNDPNDWAAESGNPRYILDLLLSVIHVSVQTVDLVAGLPEVSFS